MGNDRQNLLLIQQVQDGLNVEVGMVSENGTLSWGVNGTSSAFWQDLCSQKSAHQPWTGRASGDL